MQYNTTRSIDENQDNETLKDMTKSGKRRPWREKKIDNVSYADILEILKIKKAFNVKQCGNVLEFKPTDEGYLKLHKTWFCKSKLCPVCNWRRAMKNSYQAQKVIEEVVKEKPKARWLFLTLSTKNAIDGDTLEQSLKHLTKAFDRLSRYKKVKQNGSVAKLKLYAHLYKTIKANIVLTVKSFVSINYFSFFSINIT